MTKNQLNRDLTIVGNVVGDHLIPDIGVRVRHGQAVRLTAKQVTTSKDLVRAIAEKRVLVNDRYAANTSVIKPHQEIASQHTVQSSGCPALGFDATSLKIAVEQNTKTMQHLMGALQDLLSAVKNTVPVPVMSSPTMQQNVTVNSVVDALRSEIRQAASMASNQVGRASGPLLDDGPQYIPDLSVNTAAVISTNMSIEAEKGTSDLNSKQENLKKFKKKK